MPKITIITNKSSATATNSNVGAAASPATKRKFTDLYRVGLPGFSFFSPPQPKAKTPEDFSKFVVIDNSGDNLYLNENYERELQIIKFERLISAKRLGDIKVELKRDTSLAYQSYRNEDPLFFFALKNWVDGTPITQHICQLLFDSAKKSNMLNLTNMSGYNVWHAIMYKCTLGIAEFLFQYEQLDINQFNHQRQTPLDMIINGEKLAVCRCLLENGARFHGSRIGFNADGPSKLQRKIWNLLSRYSHQDQTD